MQAQTRHQLLSSHPHCSHVFRYKQLLLCHFVGSWLVGFALCSLVVAAVTLAHVVFSRQSLKLSWVDGQSLKVWSKTRDGFRLTTTQLPSSILWGNWKKTYLKVIFHQLQICVLKQTSLNMYTVMWLLEFVQTLLLHFEYISWTLFPYYSVYIYEIRLWKITHVEWFTDTDRMRLVFLDVYVQLCVWSYISSLILIFNIHLEIAPYQLQ